MNGRSPRDSMKEAATELHVQAYNDLRKTIVEGKHAEVRLDAHGQMYYEEYIDGELRKVYLGPGEQPPLVSPKK